MVNQNLLRWVKDTLSKGYSTEQIRNTLLQKGYKPEAINELIGATSKPSIPTSLATKPHHYGIWWTGLIVILVVAVVATLIFTNKLSLDFGTQSENQVVQKQTEQQIAQQRQEETARNLERASGTLKDLGGTF